MFVEMYRKETKEVEITLEQLKEYVKDGGCPESIDDKDVIGACEWCGQIILDGDKYEEDFEGVIQCDKHPKEFEDSQSSIYRPSVTEKIVNTRKVLIVGNNATQVYHYCMENGIDDHSYITRLEQLIGISNREILFLDGYLDGELFNNHSDRVLLDTFKNRKLIIKHASPGEVINLDNDKE